MISAPTIFPAVVCVFFGTTNEDDFLREATGNRRFFVVNIMGCEGELNVWDYLDPYTVGQLLVEAKEYFAQGEPLYLDKETEEIVREVQREHLQVDDRAGIVDVYLERLLPENWSELDLYERREWLEEPENVGTVERRRVCSRDLGGMLRQQPDKNPDTRLVRDRSHYERVFEVAKCRRANVRNLRKGEGMATRKNIQFYDNNFFAAGCFSSKVVVNFKKLLLGFSGFTREVGQRLFYRDGCRLTC